MGSLPLEQKLFFSMWFILVECLTIFKQIITFKFFFRKINLRTISKYFIKKYFYFVMFFLKWLKTHLNTTSGTDDLKLNFKGYFLYFWVFTEWEFLYAFPITHYVAIRSSQFSLMRIYSSENNSMRTEKNTKLRCRLKKCSSTYIMWKWSSHIAQIVKREWEKKFED